MLLELWPGLAGVTVLKMTLQAQFSVGSQFSLYINLISCHSPGKQKERTQTQPFASQSNCSSDAYLDLFFSLPFRVFSAPIGA